MGPIPALTFLFAGCMRDRKDTWHGVAHVSSCHRREHVHPPHVVDHRRERKDSAHRRQAAMRGLAPQGYCLQPATDRFDLLPFPPTDSRAGMAVVRPSMALERPLVGYATDGVTHNSQLSAEVSRVIVLVGTLGARCRPGIASVKFQ